MKKIKYVAMIVMAILITIMLSASMTQASDLSEPDKTAAIKKYMSIVKEKMKVGDAAAVLDALNSAAELGESEAQFALSNIYRKPGDAFELTEDIALSKKYLEQAAMNGFGRALVQLGTNYNAGINGYAENKEEAFKWFLLGAEQGDPLAQRLTAQCYLYGIGIKADNIKGEEWLKQSADQGDAVAQFSLGELYFMMADQATDDSMRIDLLEKSKSYYLAATGQGHKEAQEALKAFEWFELIE